MNHHLETTASGSPAARPSEHDAASPASNVIPLRPEPTVASRSYVDVNTYLPSARHARRSHPAGSTLLYDLDTALERDRDPVEASNIFDDWTRRLSDLAGSAIERDLGYRVLLANLIRATQNRDLISLTADQRDLIRHAMVLIQGQSCAVQQSEQMLAQMIRLGLISSLPFSQPSEADEDRIIREFAAAIGIGGSIDELLAATLDVAPPPPADARSEGQ